MAFCLGLVHLMCRMLDVALGEGAHGRLRRGILNSPPSTGLRYLSWICMAVKAMFHSRLSSSSRPTPRRSSETKAMPICRARRGSLSGTGLPCSCTFPPAGNRPMMPLGMPSLPWPARPPMPKISPLRTVKFMSRTVSPGMSTHRWFTERMSSVEGPHPSSARSRAIWRPDHPRGDVPHGDPGHRGVLDDHPVPQHHHPVGHLDDLVQAVGDEDDGDALGGQVAQGLDQDLGLGLGEHRGGLVQHQDAGPLPVDLPGDLGELLVSHRHLRDQGVRVQVDPQLGDGGRGPPSHVRPVQDAHALAEHVVEEGGAHGFPVQHDVLGGGEPRDEAELLVGHADAGVQGVEGAIEVHLLAVDADLAVVSAGFPDHVHPEQDAHEGGLPCPVLPDQPMISPALDVEGHVRKAPRSHKSLSRCSGEKEAAYLFPWFPLDIGCCVGTMPVRCRCSQRHGPFQPKTHVTSTHNICRRSIVILEDLVLNKLR